MEKSEDTGNTNRENTEKFNLNIGLWLNDYSPLLRSPCYRSGAASSS
jgi:hypothetical protein